MITHKFKYNSHEYYFNNETFEIVNKDNKPLVKTTEPNYNDNEITLKIIVNTSCNFKCNYCLQNLSHNEINDNDINQLIKFLNAEFSLKHVNRIEFWGGEPFLSFEKIIRIIEKINDKNITYSFITNGSLLSEKVCNIINNIDNKFTITISHDSYAQAITRNEEVLEKINTSISILQKNKKNTVSINNVISKYNTNLNKTINYYLEYIKYNNLTPFFVSFEVCQAYDDCSEKYVFENNSLNYNSFYSFFSAQLENQNRKMLVSLIDDVYSPSIANILKLLKQPTYMKNKTKCYVTSNNTVTYNCLTHKKVACTTFNSIQKDDILLKHRDECKMCACYRLCKGGCHLNDDRYFKINCDANKCLYTSMLNFTLSLIFNQEITLDNISSNKQ